MATRRVIAEDTSTTTATTATYGEPTAIKRAMLFGNGNARTINVTIENASAITASTMPSVPNRVRYLVETMRRVLSEVRRLRRPQATNSLAHPSS